MNSHLKLIMIDSDEDKKIRKLSATQGYPHVSANHQDQTIIHHH